MSWITRHPRLSGCIGVVFVIALIAGNAGDQGTSGQAPAAALAGQATVPVGPASVLMPNLVGMNLRDARSAAPANHSERDLSPRGRRVLDQDNWTVAATVPPAGTRILKNEEIFLFYLRNQEWRWFQANPVMPALPAGEIYQSSDSFPDIRELLEYRYAEGTEPEHAPDAHRTPAAASTIPGDPSVEPESEWGPRERLKVASGGTIAGSLSEAGQPLRPGRLITILVKPVAPPPPSPVQTYGGGPTDLDDNDENYNVPGDGNWSSGGGGRRGGGFCRSKWC
ncbi:PASTA domain-containing protein [Parafrankia sp. FMc2]|uniref:PASTA domain-containing protein n=1 Tax=Parafrankia sp. FMc2 TaxID=3233196 RepID=UPI0034D6A485